MGFLLMYGDFSTWVMMFPWVSSIFKFRLMGVLGLMGILLIMGDFSTWGIQFLRVVKIIINYYHP